MASSSVSDLRIVLLGKSGSENNRVGNTIMGSAVFHSEDASNSQQLNLRISAEVQERHITVINTHLLQPNLSHYQIIQGVSECVSLSAPGPHVIALILQYNDFSENDIKRVKYVLNLFSEQAMKHTIVLTTDEDTHGLISVPYMSTNNAIHDLIIECGGCLQFDTGNPEWCSELFRKTEEILKKGGEEFLICNLYEDEGDKTSIDEGLSRSRDSVRVDDKEEEDSDLNEKTKTGCDGGGVMDRVQTNRVSEKREQEFIEREQEFIEREEQYKRAIKKEQEEWERQIKMARQRRDEEEERSRKKECEMWDDYYRDLARERKTSQREREEFRKREEQYKREIKEREEQERKIRKEMKTEHPEIQKEDTPN